jgi:hypothetical protein
MAGGPRNAPQRPTATMAITWSGPKIGWVKPPQKSIAAPCSEWARARVDTNADANDVIHVDTRDIVPMAVW